MNSYSEVENRISEACEAAKRVQNPNLKALSRQFQVPYYRLRARLQGRATRSARKSTNKALTDIQERVLIDWIILRDSLNSAPTPEMIENSANQLLRRNTEDNASRTVSKNWVYRFIKRLPEEFKLVDQKPMEKKRLNSEDIGEIQHWYEVLEGYISKIPPRNIYNFDETGFQIGQGKAQKVVTTRPYRAKKGNPTGEVRETISAIECVSADGFILPPLFIFKGSVHLERWYEGDIPGDYRIALSPKGYTTDSIAFDWIQHFDLHTRPRLLDKNEPRLLLFDGHGSHLTYEFLQFCDLNGIIPYCFLPHTTHLIQPLDGQPFQVYKHYYRKRNNELAQACNEMEDKGDFLREIKSIRANTFKQRTVRDAWRKRGLYPFNPDEVIEPLLREKDPTPELEIYTTPPPIPSSSPPSSVQGLRRSTGKAQDYIDNSPELDGSFIRRVNRVFESSQKAFEEVAHLRSDLYDRLKDRKPQFTRKSRRNISHFGSLTVSNAQRRIEDRGEKERRQVLRQAKRAQAKRRDFSPTQADKEILIEPDDRQEDKDDERPLFFFDSQGMVV